MTEQPNTLLLRFAELSLRHARREISESEQIELEKLPERLGMSREDALKAAKDVVVDNYKADH